MTSPRPTFRRLRLAAAMTAAALLGLASGLIPPAPAGAAAVGYVRLAHLSPDTPPVDVYLSAAAEPDKATRFAGVGYGTLSAYNPLPAGRYVVAMRKAGAPATEKPVLTTEVGVAAGEAYTVAGVGRYADLGLRVIPDDLSAPAGGQAKIRVVQASVRAPVLDVVAADGPTIASGVQFATTTAYEQVGAGAFALTLRAPGGVQTKADVDLGAGSVNSLLVLDAKQGGLATELRVDAKGGAVVPAGGVDTGAGGTSGTVRPSYGLIGLAAAVLLAAVAAAAVTGSRRRARRTW